MSHIQDVYIVTAQRSPVGKAPSGALSTVRPDDLLAFMIQSTLVKFPSIPLEKIEDVIIGCAMPEAEQGMNVARIAALLAGLPDSVPGMTINRFCCSGVQSVALAANRIASGDADLIVAGGVESMSMIPMGGNKLSFSPKVFETEANYPIAYSMGITAEKVAQKWDISREAQDEFALLSHQKAIKATEQGFFKQEIIPYEVKRALVDKENAFVLAHDEGPRKDTNLHTLNTLRPVFSAKGSVTAGNSSQRSDGAGVVIVASEQAVKEYNLTPIGRLRSYAVAGVAPEYMGIGPVAAVPKALKKAGISLNDVAWIELNEAFAAQTLAVIKDLHFDINKVNPQGGAIALGHPLGATGAIRTATLLHGLRRIKERYGIVTMCIGTGMGAAAVFEMLS